MALSAFFILSNFSPDSTFAHDPDDTTFHNEENPITHTHYAENGTGPVLTYTSMDPEGMGIDWSLTGPDAGSFTISGGALQFVNPPDYESPKDVARAVGIDFNGNVSIEDPGEDAAMAMDNEYEVVVMATERRASGNAGPAKSSSTAVKVMVMNVNELGAVTMEWRQPEVGTQISALVTDPDVTATATLTVSVWQWYVSKVQVPSITDVNHWEEAGTGSDKQEYTPAKSDEGKFLRITATYAVVEGAQTMEAMAQMMSDNRVRANVARENNASPDFRGGEDKRSVDENAPVGTFVGMPVVGYDPDNDTLTYSLETAGGDNLNDFKYFSINKVTGQISVKQKLDADGLESDRVGAMVGKYEVVARVTDPSEDYTVDGARSSDTITVTITANQVNENPSVTGTAEFVIDQGMNLPDADQAGAATYMAEDPDAQTNINWVLDGEDAGDFRLAGTDARTLKFASDPDYEMPDDENGDNVYMVIVVATDGSEDGRGEKMVTVTVRNTDEDGEVTLSSAQPHLGVPLTAMLDDPDRGVNIVRWRWASAPISTPEAEWAIIAGATSATYTPSTNDNGVGIGYYLRATVTYTDPFSANDDPNTAEDERITTDSVKTLWVISDNAIQAPPGVSKVPEFPASASRRAVAENTAPGGNVGDPVLAMDPDSDDVLTYSLGGRDARFFAIDPSTGQITIGGVTELELNYEAAPNSYTVDVSAMDTAGEKGTVTVIISVTDRNEPPAFTNAPEVAIEYAENDTGPVYTFRAPDPEGRGENWDVTGPDAAQFTISGGVLWFRNSPDKETPTDIESTDPPLATADDNNYVIMVRASERRVAGYAGPAKSTELPDVTVTVTDVNEDPTVGMRWRQPEVGTPIMATLTDPDSNDPGPTWVWTVSKVQTGIIIDDEDHWDVATGTTNGATYTPADVDEAKFLRATADYIIDGVAHGPARGMSEFRVRADVLSSRNASPDFTGGETERSVDENAAVGTAVDAPVVITDPDPDGDTVTYSLETAGGDNPNDFKYFSINKVTGQISVKQKLDADGLESDRVGAMVGKYVVVARVTDPSAARDATNSNSSDMITVIITANQVNENPSVEGPVELTVDENTNLPAADDTDAATYMATDQDALTNINWELAGEDADDFRISGTGARTLRFASEPDYEMPTDANGDNVYKVMVVATDGRATDGRATDGSSGRGVRHVSVTVENVGEAGEVMLSAAQPHLSTPITAMLSDPDIPDDEVTVSWQWMRSTSSAETATFESIPGATTDTYTPVRLEMPEMGDTGYYLRATAMYRDATSDPDDEAMIMAMKTSANAVLSTPATRNAPVFPGATMTRMVDENSPSTTVVGPPVLAMDPDATDTLTYKLSGPDEGSFEIINDMDLPGQITVKLGTMLDYETTRTYTVEVTATDTTMLTDMVTVTIMVVDMNEAPDQPKELFGGLAITGPTSMDYEEGMTAAIGTYVAVGPVAGMATWSLSGDDMGDFNISNMGELTFASVPDYEMPMDMDMDNMYEITVMGNDGTNPAVGYDVIVAVTNMDEMGEVTLWDGMDALTMAPQVDDTITGAVMDPDGGETVESWQWARTMDTADMSSWMDIPGATDAAYTVTDDDAGYYLRATATYTDGEGMGKMASEETMMVGAEAGDPLLAKYDGDKDGWIQLEEARDAVGDYFGPPKGEKLSLDDTRKVVGLYFLYKNRQQ